MKNQLKVILATLAAASISLGAQADTIATWTFETNTPADLNGSTTYTTPIAADVGAGTATGVHLGAANWSTPVGNGSANSFSATSWSVGDYFQFSASTTGYTGITLSWDQISSATGPRDFTLAYSTDGVSFTNVANYSVLVNATPNTWSSGTTSSASSFSQNLSLDTALDNQTQVFFRLLDRSAVSANGGTVAGGGTDRVDNFSVNGVAAVPVPAAAWLMGSSLLGLAGVARKRRTA